jgi:hypothetical protein
VPPSDFLLPAFCLVDDPYRQLVRTPIRSRGPRATAPSDAEVITVEPVGEFLGLDHDTGLFQHFRRYRAAAFPGPLRVHRTAFARQAARAFGRAGFARRFRGGAGCGRGPTRRGLMDGFRLHARATPAGAIVALDPAPANVSGLAMIDRLGPPPGSVGVRDRGYWSPRVRAELAGAGVTFLAPYQSRKADPDPDRSRRLGRIRWIMATAFGQLAGRFAAKRTWARDLWHLSHRVIRKALSHTAAVRINLASGRSALDFDGLIAG